MSAALPDKRDECGCHRGCLDGWPMEEPHTCPNPCRWPECLTDAEHVALLAAMTREWL